MHGCCDGDGWVEFMWWWWLGGVRAVVGLVFLRWWCLVGVPAVVMFGWAAVASLSSLRAPLSPLQLFFVVLIVLKAIIVCG